jgi:hypothetical protein
LSQRSESVWRRKERSLARRFPGRLVFLPDLCFVDLLPFGCGRGKRSISPIQRETQDEVLPKVYESHVCAKRKPSDRLPVRPSMEPRFGLLAPATNKPILVTFRATANKNHQHHQTQLPRPRRRSNRRPLKILGCSGAYHLYYSFFHNHLLE